MKIAIEHLGTSRYEVMKWFRKNNQTQTLQAIAAEYLKLTPQDYLILTQKQFPRLFYGYILPLQRGASGSTVTALQQALKDSGVDPELAITGSFDAETYAAVKKFQERHELEQTGRVGAATWPIIWKQLIVQVPEFLPRTKLTYPELLQLLETRFVSCDRKVKIDMPAGSQCDLSTAKLQFEDSNILSDEILSKIHRFLRLQRKLGWSMADLDKTLTALDSTDITPNFLWKLAQVAWLQTELNVPLVNLLSLWADIDTHGENSLYQTLFLNKAAQVIDPLFDPLPNEDRNISDCMHRLQSALRMSAKDLFLIQTDTGLKSDETKLTITNISLIYRYTVLAKALKLKIADLIALKRLTGINPFKAKQPSKTWLFVELAKQVKASKFAIAQLSYLYRHVAEPSSRFIPQLDTVLLLAKTLREGLTQIATEHQFASDPTGEVTRTKLELLFEAETCEQLIQIINGTFTCKTPLTEPSDPDLFSEAEKARFFHDPGLNELCFKGSMTPSEKQNLLARSENQDYQSAIENLYQQPRDFTKNMLADLLNFSELEAALLDCPSRTLDGKEILLDRDGNQTADQTQAVTTGIAKKFADFLEQFLPKLRDRLSQGLIVEALSQHLNLDSEITSLLVKKILNSPNEPDKKVKVKVIEEILTIFAQSPETIQSSPWQGKLLVPDSDDYTFSVYAQGTIKLWVGDDVTPVIDSNTASLEEVTSSQPIALNAGEFYNLRLEVEVTELNDNDTDSEVENTSPAIALYWSSATTPKAVIPASQLYPASILDTFTRTFTLLDKVAQPIEGFELTADELDRIHKTHFWRLAFQNLPLAPAAIEPQTFLTWQRLHNYVTLRNSLPVSDITLLDVFEFAATAADNRELSDPVLRGLLDATQQNPDFAEFLAEWTNTPLDELKERLDANEPLAEFRLLLQEGIQDGKLSKLQIQCLILAIATGWDIKALVSLVENSPLKDELKVLALSNEFTLLYVQICLNLVKRVGASVEQLTRWANPFQESFKQLLEHLNDGEDNQNLVQSIQMAVSETLGSAAQEIKDCVRAKYEEEIWRSVAKPLNDELRERQKAALIDYILAVYGLDDSNQLLEYLSIDVNMSACMLTSRLKQAVSSVQLFVQRCLMNLEPQVSPKSIDADYWEWMKRYRVWEANRKVFLYPENWIEPELRDDKSPFFKELESELLQNDLTEPYIETVFLSYLYKLDEVARLEICAMYWEGVDDGREPGEEILHVFGRAFDSPNIYYRKLINETGIWTAWELVNVGIDLQPDGVHLIPVVFNRRLYLFWPIFTEKPDEENPAPEGAPPRMKWEIQLAWSEYWDSKWQPKQVASANLVSYEHWEEINSEPIEIVTRTVKEAPYFVNSDDTKVPLPGLRWETTRIEGTDKTYKYYLPSIKEHFFRVEKTADKLQIKLAVNIVHSKAKKCHLLEKHISIVDYIFFGMWGYFVPDTGNASESDSETLSMIEETDHPDLLTSTMAEPSKTTIEKISMDEKKSGYLFFCLWDIFPSRPQVKSKSIIVVRSLKKKKRLSMEWDTVVTTKHTS